MSEGSRPGSSWGIHCGRAGCPETIVLARTTTTQPTHEQDYQELSPACSEAALFLGWRIFRSVYWCPTHVVSLGLACKRCLLPCPACACMRGPHIDAVEGELEMTS